MNKILLHFFIFVFAFSTNQITFTQVEEEADSIAAKRNLWFYAQRFNPFDSIPPNAMIDALIERDNILNTGYQLNPIVNTWKNIGPRYNNSGGRLNFAKFTNDNSIIIGTPHAGLWKYENNAWINMDPNNALKSNHSGATAIDYSVNPPIIYYGTGEGFYGSSYAYFGKGIYKSTNWGANWIEINNGINTEHLLKIFRITIRPGYPNQIFAATNQGLYRTIN